MPAVQTGACVETSTPWSETSTEPTGASRRCHVTFPLRLTKSIWWAMPSPPSLLESSVTWPDVLYSDWGKIRSMSLRMMPSREWSLSWIFGCGTTRFQLFTQECSEDWAIWEKCGWLSIKFPPLNHQPSKTWDLFSFLSSVGTGFQFFLQDCSQDWSIWESSACGGIKSLKLKKVHLIPCFQWGKFICNKTSWPPWAQKCSWTYPDTLCSCPWATQQAPTNGIAAPSAGWIMRSNRELSRGMEDAPHNASAARGVLFHVVIQVSGRFRLPHWGWLSEPKLLTSPHLQRLQGRSGATAPAASADL